MYYYNMCVGGGGGGGGAGGVLTSVWRELQAALDRKEGALGVRT